VGYTNAIYASADEGVTGKSNSVSGITFWQGIASSADGSKLVAAAQNGSLFYISTNSGASWTQGNNVPSGTFDGITSSADGNKLVIIPGHFYSGTIGSFVGGPIFTSYSTPTPQLSLTSLNNNFAISWIVPSTNFVLQQNCDLTTPNWVTLTNVPTLNLSNLQDQVFFSPSNSNGFYRLATP
jgi:hypothetical protein